MTSQDVVFSIRLLQAFYIIYINQIQLDIKSMVATCKCCGVTVIFSPTRVLEDTVSERPFRPLTEPFCWCSLVPPFWHCFLVCCASAMYRSVRNLQRFNNVLPLQNGVAVKHCGPAVGVINIYLRMVRFICMSTNTVNVSVCDRVMTFSMQCLATLSS